MFADTVKNPGISLVAASETEEAQTEHITLCVMYVWECVWVWGIQISKADLSAYAYDSPIRTSRLARCARGCRVVTS